MHKYLQYLMVKLVLQIVHDFMVYDEPSPSEYRYGQGMAAAVILFILILIFTMIQNYVLKKISK